MLSIVYCIIAGAALTGLWIFLIGWDINLLVSVLSATLLFSFVAGKLSHGAWEGFHRELMRPKWPRRIFWVTLLTAYFVSSVISGDWTKNHQIPPTCIITEFGDLHLHHWLKGLALLAWHGNILRIFRLCPSPTRKRMVISYGNQTLTLSSILFFIATLCIWLNIGTMSLKVDVLFYAVGLAFLGIVCRSAPDINSRLRLIIAFNVAIAVAIAISSVPTFLNDIMTGYEIPSTVIFWHSNGDPTCHM